MLLLFYFLIFVFGAAVGSFLGVVVDRLASKESIWVGRSHCDHCRHNLHPFDLIPVLSYFILGRKCRYCHKPLSWFYPVIEVTTGLAYLASAYAVLAVSPWLIHQYRYLVLVLYYFLLFGSLIVIFFCDVKYGIIPFKIVMFALIVTLLWDIYLNYLRFSPLEFIMLGLQFNISSIILSAIGASGFFLLLFLLTKGRGMGFGDVVYAFLMGFILGYPRVILGLYIAFVTGAIVSIVLVLSKKKKFKGGTIPFGPFLVFGTFVSLLWGSTLIESIVPFSHVLISILQVSQVMLLLK